MSTTNVLTGLIAALALASAIAASPASAWSDHRHVFPLHHGDFYSHGW